MDLMIWLKNVEDFIKYKEWSFKESLKAYRERVINYYQDEFNENNNNFPFMSPVKAVAIFRDYEIIIYYIHSTNKKDEFFYQIDEFENYEEYKKNENMPEHIKQARLLKIADIDNYIEKSISWYGESSDPVPNYDLEATQSRGRSLADKHFRNLEQIGLTLPSLNIKKYLSSIDNEHFKYELKEAIKAFDNKLYLASTVTAAVSLETLLRTTIVSTLGEKQLPQNNRDKHTLNYATILLDNGIITERMNHRIRALNELRRASAHSKTGIITEWDAEQYLTGIFELVSFFFSERN